MTTPVTTFDSTREALSDLMNSIKSGKTQLPDFQRGWVWDDSHIRSLLASVSLTFPVGAVMMLQTGNPAVRFKPRPVEGAANAAHAERPVPHPSSARQSPAESHQPRGVNGS